MFLLKRYLRSLRAIFAPGGNYQQDQGSKRANADRAKETGCECHPLILDAAESERNEH